MGMSGPNSVCVCVTLPYWFAFLDRLDRTIFVRWLILIDYKIKEWVLPLIFLIMDNDI